MTTAQTTLHDEEFGEMARVQRCIGDALDILGKIKRGQNSTHVLRLRDDAVAFLRIALTAPPTSEQTDD